MLACCFASGGYRTPVTQHSRDTPQFYLTAPSPCPYLAGKEERKVFTHLVGERAPELNDLLTHGGFRAYLDSRHHDGGMADMTVLDYAMMVEDSHVETKMVEYRHLAPGGGRDLL